MTDNRNAAVCTDGEDVAILTKKDAAELLHVALERIPRPEAMLAALGRVPRFRELFPGVFEKVGSSPAPALEIRQTSLTLDGVAIAGYVNGDVVRIEPRSGRVDSAQRGRIAPGRCIDVLECDHRSVATVVGDEVWILAPDHVRILDLDARTVRKGPTLEGFEGLALVAPWEITSTAESLLCITAAEVRVFRRGDGTLVARHELPKNRGAVAFDGGVAFIPKDAVTSEGFAIERLDLVTGERSELARYRLDTPRTSTAGDPADWIHLKSIGKQITAQGDIFDPRTATFGADVPSAVMEASHRYSTKSRPGHVAIADRGEMIVYDLDAPGFSVLAQFALDDNLERAKPATFSRRSGRSAAAIPGSRIAVWERDGRRVTELLGHRDPTDMWLSQNGRTLAVFDSRSRAIVRLWALED